MLCAPLENLEKTNALAHIIFQLGTRMRNAIVSLKDLVMVVLLLLLLLMRYLFIWCIWLAFNNDVVFADFVDTDKGVTCSESGFMDLSTAQQCSAALNYAMSFNSGASYQFEDSWSGNPKGCFIFDWGSMYFNTHSTGGRNYYVVSICENGNTWFWVHYSALGK